MKTAQTIEEQPERKAARDNGDSSPENRPPAREKLKQRDPARIAPWTWKPGQSGNPGGRPKHDLAAEIAKACFENNAEALYQAFSKALLKGNAYAFKELSDRAYGRLKERVELEAGPFKDVPIEDLEQEIKRLEEQLGYTRREEPSEPAILPPAEDDSKSSKPN